MQKSELVFAYGSNMDPAQMRERCPESDLSWFLAEARGWKLCFPRKSKNRKGGVGSVTKDVRSSVWGVVFSVTPKDLLRLDEFEGAKGGSYRRDRIDVIGEDGISHRVWTYFAMPQGNYLPVKDYIRLYLRGADYFSLPENYIEKLKATKTKK